MTSALALPDTTDIQAQQLTYTDKARELTVATPEQYETATELLKEIKALTKQIDATFDPVISAAHKAHKEACAAMKQHRDPLEMAERVIRQKATKYITDQERARMEAQRKAEEEARAAEDKRRRDEAAALKKAGDKAAAKAVLAAPIVLDPVQVSVPAPPKVEGVSTRKVWKYRIVNSSAIPRAFLLPNEKAIGDLVRRLGPEAAGVCAGIEIYEDAQISIRG